MRFPRSFKNAVLTKSYTRKPKTNVRKVCINLLQLKILTPDLHLTSHLKDGEVAAGKKIENVIDEFVILIEDETRIVKQIMCD